MNKDIIPDTQCSRSLGRMVVYQKNNSGGYKPATLGFMKKMPKLLNEYFKPQDPLQVICDNKMSEN